MLFTVGWRYILVIRLSLQNLKIYKKRTVATSLAIFLMCFLLIAVNALNNTLNSSKEYQRINTYGKWSYVQINGELPVASEYTKVGTMYHLGAVSESDNKAYLASFDSDMFNLASLELSYGRLPSNRQEVIVEANALTTLGYDYSLNQNIRISANDVSYELTVVGIFLDYTGSWRNDAQNPINYPKFITIGKTSDEISQFGYSDRVSVTGIDQLLINIEAYPQLNYDDTNARELWIEESKLEQQRTEQLTAALLILSGFVMMNVFRFGAGQTKKQILLLRILGVDKKNSFVYLLVQSIFYTIVIVPIGFLVSFLCIRFSFDYFIADVFFSVDWSVVNRSFIFMVCIVSLSSILMSISGVFSPLVGGLAIPTKKSIVFQKILYSLTLFVISAGVLFLVFTNLIDFTSRTLKEYQTFTNEIIPNAAFYEISARTEVIMSEQDKYSIVCENGASQDQCGVSKTEAEKIRLLDGVESVSVTSSVFVESFTNNERIDINVINGYGATLFIFDSSNMDYLSSIYGTSPSTDFINGKTVYFENITETSDDVKSSSAYKQSLANLQPNRTIYLGENNQSFIIEDWITSYNEENLSGQIYSGTYAIYISDAGAQRLGLSTDYYQEVFVQAEKKGDYSSLDIELAKLVRGNKLINQRLSAEKFATEFIFSMQFQLLSIVMVVMIGFGIFINIYSHNVIRQRRDLGLKKLLGFKNSQIVRSFLIRNLLPVVLAIPLAFIISIQKLAADHHQRYLENPYGDLSVIRSFENSRADFIQRYLTWDASLKYVVFAMIVFAVALIIMNIWPLYGVLRNNPFENISEKE